MRRFQKAEGRARTFLYLLWFTPTTYMGASADGAEMTTLLAPAFKCKPAFSAVVNAPVDSTTNSALDAPQPSLDGSLSLNSCRGDGVDMGVSRGEQPRRRKQ